MFLFVEDDLFIYNPSTRMCNGLPFRRRNCKPEWYSFGYDESTDDYKIVELVEISLPTRPYYIIKGQVYSLNTRKWRDIGDFPYGYNYPLNGCGIFSNGALHWEACDEPLTPRIVSFDLAKETYAENFLFDYDVLGVLGECLCGLCYYYYQSPEKQGYADVWVMKVYGVKDSWIKLASFSYDDGIDEYMAPLFLLNDGKMLFDCASTLVISNLKNSSSPQIEYISYILDASIVVENLVSPFPPLGSRKGKSTSMASSTRGELTSSVSLTSSKINEFNNITSESYWLSRIRESEEAAMHHISLGFFKLILEAGFQNIKQLRDELESYDCRHNLLGLGESAKQVFQSCHILKQQEKIVNYLES